MPGGVDKKSRVKSNVNALTWSLVEIKGVPVSINDTGPFDFILDTGANVTVVKRKLLLQLNIADTKPVKIVTAAGESRHQRATVGSISVGGLSVENLEINTLDGAQTGALGGQVQGILGENFLKNCDLLIDNERQILVLDRTSSLAGTLTGERLPLSCFGRFGAAPTPDRVIVRLKVPSYLEKPLLLLVDSGASTAVLYPAPGGYAIRAMQSSQGAGLRDLDEHVTVRFNGPRCSW
jgi:predicted aspartyl protease